MRTGPKTQAWSCARGGVRGQGIFFRLQVYERVEISLAEVYERVGKSVIWVSEIFWQENVVAVRHPTTSFSENVVVTETSYQMLTVLICCDREKS